MPWNIDLECRDAEDARRERNHRVFNGGNMSEHDLNQMHDWEDRSYEEYCDYLDDLEEEERQQRAYYQDEPCKDSRLDCMCNGPHYDDPRQEERNDQEICSES